MIDIENPGARSVFDLEQASEADKIGSLMATAVFRPLELYYWRHPQVNRIQQSIAGNNSLNLMQDIIGASKKGELPKHEAAQIQMVEGESQALQDMTDVFHNLVLQVCNGKKDILQYKNHLKLLLLNQKVQLSKKTQDGKYPLDMLFQAWRGAQGDDKRLAFQEVLALYVSVSPDLTPISVSSDSTKACAALAAIMLVRACQAVFVNFIVRITTYPVFQMSILSFSMMAGYFASHAMFDYLVKGVDKITVDQRALSGSFVSAFPFSYFGLRVKDVVPTVATQKDDSFKSQYDVRLTLLHKYMRLEALHVEGRWFERYARYVSVYMCKRTVERAYNSIKLEGDEKIFNESVAKAFDVFVKRLISKDTLQDLQGDLERNQDLRLFVISLYEYADKGRVHLDIQQMVVLKKLVDFCLAKAPENNQGIPFVQSDDRKQRILEEAKDNPGMALVVISQGLLTNSGDVDLKVILNKQVALMSSEIAGIMGSLQEENVNFQELASRLLNLSPQVLPDGQEAQKKLVATVMSDQYSSVAKNLVYGFSKLLSQRAELVNPVAWGSGLVDDAANTQSKATWPDLVQEVLKGLKEGFMNKYRVNAAQQGRAEHSESGFLDFICTLRDWFKHHVRALKMPANGFLISSSTAITGLAVYTCAYTFLNMPLYIGALVLYSYPTLKNAKEDFIWVKNETIACCKAIKSFAIKNCSDLDNRSGVVR